MPITSSRRFLLLALTALVMAIDGYDLVAMSLAAPYVMPELQLTEFEVGAIFSSVLVGLGLGAVVLAPLGDRLGRRLVVVAGLLLIAVTTLGTASGSGYIGFSAWRFGTGLGLGVCLPNVTALASELASEQRRATVVTVISAGISVGAVSAGLITPLLVGLGGWHVIFIAPAVLTLVLAALFAVFLPKGQAARAAGADAPARSGYSAVMRPPLLSSTLVIVALYSANAIALYWFMNWLPVVIPKAGFAVETGGHFLSLAQGGGLVAALLLGVLIDRGLVRLAFAGCYALMIAALLSFLVLPSGIVGWGGAVLVAGGTIAGLQIAIISATTRALPAHALSTVIGLAVAVARVGAIAGPMVGSAALDAGASPAEFFALLAIPALAGLLIATRFPKHAPTTQAPFKEQSA